jgi:uncharacterized protein (DUF433 family)
MDIIKKVLIVDAYNNGATILQIAKAYQLPPRIIREIIKKDIYSYAKEIRDPVPYLPAF